MLANKVIKSGGFFANAFMSAAATALTSAIALTVAIVVIASASVSTAAEKPSAQSGGVQVGNSQSGNSQSGNSQSGSSRTGNSQPAGVLREGAPLPSFVLTDENDKKNDLYHVIDRPTVIYFTHNSCFYCVQVVAFLKRADAKYGGRLRIIGINVMAKDGELIKAYKENLGFSFPMFAGNREDVLTAFRVNYVPIIVFVDSKKIVRKVVGHYIGEKVLHQYIEDILKN
jgi:thiol-disulfide isomerase/thioredoxin